jgi:hypothetical protein
LIDQSKIGGKLIVPGRILVHKRRKVLKEWYPPLRRILKGKVQSECVANRRFQIVISAARKAKYESGVRLVEAPTYVYTVVRNNIARIAGALESVLMGKTNTFVRIVEGLEFANMVVDSEIVKTVVVKGSVFICDVNTLAEIVVVTESVNTGEGGTIAEIVEGEAYVNTKGKDAFAKNVKGLGFVFTGETNAIAKHAV